ncbi:MAG: hypothetical protein GF364_21340 [Candidatus Lokiarchaeota archaeon]|nr:hypothetical protein [Candidatus Lokiarchaeota archaeon]
MKKVIVALLLAMCIVSSGALAWIFPIPEPAPEMPIVIPGPRPPEPPKPPEGFPYERPDWVDNIFDRFRARMEYFVPKGAIELVEKNPVTWEIVEGGAHGYLKLFRGSAMFAKGYRLEPETEYTLIYYGDETHNNQYPYATCIGSSVSDEDGKLLIMAHYDYSDMVNDGIDQKFWVVLSNDLDCGLGRFTTWNPTEYLFETETI